jgi:MarR family transcriptional regulator, negative regulator of the multidrug operon emrRAB
MIDADANRIGALAIALGDRLRAATEDAADMPASYPAALSALRTWAGGRPVEVLADGLRVSHSRAVRVVDRLEADGLARRRPDRCDRRAVRIELTALGRRAADGVQAARTAALEEALARLSRAERAQLGELAARVLGELTEGRRSARGICRLCDPVACGHYGGDCPVTRAADRAEAAA